MPLHCIGRLWQECVQCHIINSIRLWHYWSVWYGTFSHQCSYDGTYYIYIRLHAVIFIHLWHGRSVRYASFLHQFSYDGCIWGFVFFLFSYDITEVYDMPPSHISWVMTSVYEALHCIHLIMTEGCSVVTAAYETSPFSQHLSYDRIWKQRPLGIIWIMVWECKMLPYCVD